MIRPFRTSYTENTTRAVEARRAAQDAVAALRIHAGARAVRPYTGAAAYEEARDYSGRVR